MQHYAEIQTLKQREDIKFSTIWEKATIGDSIGIELTKPRTASNSRFRSNAGCDHSGSTIDYYRRNVYYPFIDHCVQQFKDRFPNTSQSLFVGYKLLPSKLPYLTKEDVKGIEEFYGPYLPDRPSFEGEVEKWKIKFDQRESPSVLSKYSLSDALKDADKEFFPNIHGMMKLILTLPVGSVPCERSFSAMRRLKDWSRSESRTNGLALLYTHRDMEVNHERFDATGHRKIGSLY